MSRVDTDRLPPGWRPVFQPARPATVIRLNPPALSPAMIAESRTATPVMPDGDEMVDADAITDRQLGTLRSSTAISDRLFDRCRERDAASLEVAAQIWNQRAVRRGRAQEAT